MIFFANLFADPADVPLERTDKNSQLAHQQLLEKAHKGGIDLYFEGDSITRRWGTSDPGYKDFYANWKENFFGWNAADFGWGGDRTQNILWRLQHGELDGVQPKVIVLLAGTNNIPSNGINEDEEKNIATGVLAIVHECVSRAPNAKLIVTGIFHRAGTVEFNKGIDAINKLIASGLPSPSISFIDINDGLCDSSGLLKPGITVDGLHPALEGYKLWASRLKPIIFEILGAPASTDHAPPATGDPSASH